MVFPSSNQKSQRITHILVKDIVPMFGVPEALLSQGFPQSAAVRRSAALMLLFAFFGRGAATTRAHAHNASFDLLPFLPRLASCWCRLCVLALDIMSLSSEASSSGLAKRPKIDTSKHSVGYQQSWEKEYPWLMAVESGGEVTGMLCILCKRHKTKNKQNQSSVWGSTPCTCLRKDSVRRHAKNF